MEIQEQFSLKALNSFGLEAWAEVFVRFRQIEDLPEIRNLVQTNSPKPFLILGGGSNLLFKADFPGLVVQPAITGIHRLHETDRETIVRAGAGVVWDDLVAFAVSQGLGGLENLSLIPGTVGACPIQNIGAYGCEVADTIHRVETYDLETGTFVELDPAECRFGYRTSFFKTPAGRSHVIHHVQFRLHPNPKVNTSYGALEQVFHELGGGGISTLRKAVIRIRQSRLPDPSVLGNAGSFFKNPVISEQQALELLKHFPDLPRYAEEGNRFKITAGWLIDRTGMKGFRKGDAGTYEKQALILVNHGKATGTDILNLAADITHEVEKMFGLSLEPEVNIV